MKNTFRLLVICLAFVLCMLPALVACDPEPVQDDDTSSETTVENAEGTASDTDPTASPDKNPGTEADETEATVTDPAETNPAESEGEPEATEPEATEPEATEPEETEPAETEPPVEEVVFEGTPVCKSDNIPRTMVLKVHKLAAMDATGVTKCSLVLYDSEGNVLNYVLFDFVGGKEPAILALKKTTWKDDKCIGLIAHADGTTQEFELSYSK